MSRILQSILATLALLLVVFAPTNLVAQVTNTQTFVTVSTDYVINWQTSLPVLVYSLETVTVTYLGDKLISRDESTKVVNCRLRALSNDIYGCVMPKSDMGGYGVEYIILDSKERRALGISVWDSGYGIRNTCFAVVDRWPDGSTPRTPPVEFIGVEGTNYWLNIVDRYFIEQRNRPYSFYPYAFSDHVVAAAQQYVESRAAEIRNPRLHP